MKTGKHELQVLAVQDRGPAILRPGQAASAFAGVYDDRRESFIAVYLDSRHRPLAAPYVVSVGSINASLVHPREVFRPAVEVGAVALLVAHNHPSGDPSPSTDDLALTARLDKAADIMGIALLDHIIFGDSENTSIRETGWPGGKS